MLAISEFPKGRKYLISLSFRGKASVRPAQVGGFDVNIVIHGSTAVRGRGDLVAYRKPLWKLTAPWTHRTRPPHLGKRCAFSTSSTGPFPSNHSRKTPKGPKIALGNPEQHVNSVSRDGVVAFSEINPTTGLDLWTLAPSADPAPFANTPFNEQQGRFSPDGRFIAYVSDESGRNEVYVRPYPGPGERVTVSDAGGVNPLWSRAGDELFYREGDDLTAVPVQTSPTLELGEPVRVMDVGAFQPSGDVNPTIAIAPDGERFLMVRKPPGARGQINVVLNWDKELRERVPLP